MNVKQIHLRWVFTVLASAAFASPLPAQQAAPNQPAQVAVEPGDSLADLARQLAEKPAESRDAATPVATILPSAEAPSVIPPAPAVEQLPLGLPASAVGTPPANGPAVSEQSDRSWVLTTVMALAVVLGLIFVVKAAVQKSTGRSSAARVNPALEVLARVSVAPKSHVLLVRLGRRVLAVGDSGQGLRTLADIDDPEEVAQILTSLNAGKANSVTRQFNDLMGRLNGEYDDLRHDDEGGDAAEARVDRTRNTVSNMLARLESTRTGGKR